MTDTQLNLNAPWSLGFYRDGTEDVAIIGDAEGEVLVTSRHFWRPEGDDPTPPTLAAMRVMNAAPKLLVALRDMVSWAELHGLTMAPLITGGQAECPVIINARAALADATDDSIGRVA